MVFFGVHLLILIYPDHHQNLISSSLYYPGPLHKISYHSIHNFWSNVVHRQTDRQTNQRYQKHNLLCQIITPILPTVKILSLGGERLPLPPPPHTHTHTKKKKKKKKVLNHYLHHDLGMPPLLWCFLLIYSS